MAIFGAEKSEGAIYQAGKAKVTISGFPAILLQVGVTISRQLSPIPTLGHGIQWSAQNPTGSLQASGIVTRSMDLVGTLTNGDACNKLEITVDMASASCSSEGRTAKKLQIHDGYCSQISFDMSGQQGYIGSSIAISFTSADIT